MRTSFQFSIRSGGPVATNATGDPGSFTLENLLKRRGAGSRSPKVPHGEEFVVAKLSQVELHHTEEQKARVRSNQRSL